MSYPRTRCDYCGTTSTNQPAGDACHSCHRGVMRITASHYLDNHNIKGAPARIPLSIGRYKHDYDVVERELPADLVEQLREGCKARMMREGKPITVKTLMMPMGVNRADLRNNMKIMEANNGINC